MAHEQFTYSDFQLTETQFLRDVDDAIQNAADLLTELGHDIDEIELRKAVEKSAHLEAINFITERAQDLLVHRRVNVCGFKRTTITSHQSREAVAVATPIT